MVIDSYTLNIDAYLRDNYISPNPLRLRNHNATISHSTERHKIFFKLLLVAFTLSKNSALSQKLLLYVALL